VNLYAVARLILLCLSMLDTVCLMLYCQCDRNNCGSADLRTNQQTNQIKLYDNEVMRFEIHSETWLVAGLEDCLGLHCSQTNGYSMTTCVVQEYTVDDYTYYLNILIIFPHKYSYLWHVLFCRITYLRNIF
jgi:hypothetical protein